MASRSPSKSESSKPSTGYTVLARRYRSRNFDELIGQEPIARTLLNAIKAKRTAHAYLFCGTRGVGKTSMARIFAKALNATDDLKEKDAIGEAILRGDDLDVIEIDGASNRGIDNARDLIAGAGLSPTRCPYKIYIIDEVHMLTREAFNALLKTMEEPPKHVKFILCTTEAHKVPATIQSRCQRFDFRPISSTKIAQQLRHILGDENIKADDEVIAQVARLGNGSMRDALSLLDRLLAAGEAKLTMTLVEEMLGLPDQARISQLVDAIAAGDAGGALTQGAALLGTGASPEQVFDLLAEHFRTLMIIAACGTEAEFLDLSEEHLKVATAQAAKFDAAGLVHMIAVCDAASRNAKFSAAARAIFDAAVVRLCMCERFADIAGVLRGAPLPEPKSTRALPSSAESKKKAPELVPGRSEHESAVTAPSWIREPVRSPAVTEVKTLVADAEPPPTGKAFWDRVLAVAAGSPADRMRTEHLQFQSFDGQVLRLELDESGADIAQFLSQNVDRLIDLVRRATGRSVRVDLDTSRVLPRFAAPSAVVDDVAKRPAIVNKAIDLFGAVIVRVDDLANAPSSRVNAGNREDLPNV
jgi:DNA polymerase-3 subunit gamma/tau